MNKRKEGYKKLIVAQLLLSIFLFENCNKSNSTPVAESSHPTQEVIQYETIATDKTDEQEEMSLVQQGRPGFADLPIELQAYILSFLEQKELMRASWVCHGWREAAFMAGEEKTLDLSNRKLTREQCQALQQAPFSSLFLKKCGFLWGGGASIISQFARLKGLNLGYNSIGNEGCKALASGVLTALTSLELEHNNIYPEGAKALAGGNLINLKTLDLGQNQINTEGAIALAGGNFPALTMLDLTNNSCIGNKGAIALVGGNLRALVALHLGANGINDEGVRALTNGVLTALAVLKLGSNNIGIEGLKMIVSS